MAKEIERRFIVSGPPILTFGDIQIQFIQQTYLSTSGDSTLRVRKIFQYVKGKEEEKYTMCYKEGKGIVRDEFEFEIDRSTYQDLLNLDKKRKPLIKNRFTSTDGGIRYDMDIYAEIELQKDGTIVKKSDPSPMFAVVEVEFETEEEANEFQPLEWMGEEISNNKKYSNKSLWKLSQ